MKNVANLGTNCVDQLLGNPQSHFFTKIPTYPDILLNQLSSSKLTHLEITYLLGEMMKRTLLVQDVLVNQREIRWISPEATMDDVITSLATNRVSGLLVARLRPDGLELLGIVTERDVVTAQANNKGLGTLVISFMTASPLMTTTPDTPLMEVAEHMTINSVRHMPVMVHGHPVGMVSIRDVVRLVLDYLNQRLAEAESDVFWLRKLMGFEE